MSQIKKLIRSEAVLPFLLFLILVLFPLEHKYDKVFRSTFRALNFSHAFVENFYFYVTDFLASCFIILGLIRSGWKQIFWNRNTKFICALIIISLLSILFCDIPFFSMQWVRWVYFCIALFFFSSVQSVEWKAEVWIPRIFWAILFVALFECFIALFQYLTQHALGLRIFSEPKLKIGSERATFYLMNGSQWIFGSTINGPKELLRAYGTFPHPNVLGGYLLFSLMTAYHLWCQYTNKWLKLFLFLAITLQILGLFLSFSRSAMIGWGIASILWIIGMRKNRNARALSFLLILLFLMYIIIFYPQLKSRGGIINYNQTTRSADSERIIFQNLALKMILKYPFKGIGYANLGQRNAEFLEGDYPAYYLHTAVHNIYLYIAAEVGVFGLLAFLGFLFSVFHSFFRSRPSPLKMTLFALFIGFLFIGGCDFYLLQFQQGKWMFFATAAMIAYQGKYDKSEPALASVGA